MDISVKKSGFWAEITIGYGDTETKITIGSSDFSSSADAFRDAADELSYDPNVDRIKELEGEVDDLKAEIERLEKEAS